MKRLAELVLYPILAISALVLFLYPAFLVPEALRLYLIFLGLAGIVICCYLVHWYRYPGIFRSKSPARWLGHVVLATVLLVLAPILAVVHVTGLTEALGHVIKLNKLLGLDFRFEPGERVRIRSDAPSFFRPEAAGRVLSVRSVKGTSLGTPYPAERTICYLIQFEDGVTQEIPEQFLGDVGPDHKS